MTTENTRPPETIDSIACPPLSCLSTDQGQNGLKPVNSTTSDEHLDRSIRRYQFIGSRLVGTKYIRRRATAWHTWSRCPERSKNRIAIAIAGIDTRRLNSLARSRCWHSGPPSDASSDYHYKSKTKEKEEVETEWWSKRWPQRNAPRSLIEQSQPRLRLRRPAGSSWPMMINTHS